MLPNRFSCIVDEMPHTLRSRSHKVQNPSHQTIYFGSPGTGKSFKIKNSVLKDISEDCIFRTTFHPDTDYASFVGCYKPTMHEHTSKVSNFMTYEELVVEFKKYLDTEFLDRKTQKSWKNITTACAKFGYDFYDNIIDMEDKGEHTIPNLVADAYKPDSTYDTSVRAGMQIYIDSSKIYAGDSKIAYRFIPQVFTEAYVKAWKNKTENVYLVIEEINRGNCAQIFGDLFQLLDRDDNGFSEYTIRADVDLAQYLANELGCNHEGIADGKIKLPNNLYILATMNTSDQSLFPMDSAFKRRWEWKFIPTTPPKDNDKTITLSFSENFTTQYGITIEAGDYEYNWIEFLNKINEKIRKSTHSEDKQLGFWFVKTLNKNNSISISAFVSKVIFYLWNDVFKDMGAKDTNPFTIQHDEKKELMSFNSFFEVNSLGQTVENIGVLHTCRLPLFRTAYN